MALIFSVSLIFQMSTLFYSESKKDVTAKISAHLSVKFRSRCPLENKARKNYNIFVAAVCLNHSLKFQMMQILQLLKIFLQFMDTSAGAALWGEAMLEQCSESCDLWEAHMGSVGEGQHLVGQRHTEQWDDGGAAEMKHYELISTPIKHSFMLLMGGNMRGWVRERCSLILVLTAPDCYQWAI